MSHPTSFHTFALVAFGGRVLDPALATDFVMIAKKFIADGLHPTCLSGTNLFDITSTSGPFIFGRDDLRERIQVYDSDEATRPFYQLEAHGIKSHIMCWIRDVSGNVRPGDRIIIVLIGHGSHQESAVTLHCQRGPTQYLSKAEMVAALSVLPPKVRLLVVNGACYSGTWTTIAHDIGTQQGSQRDVLIETAATIGEKSWAYVSGSGRDRCSLFGAAFIEEITTYPESRISLYRNRIVDEMLYIRPNQETSTPLTIPSTRALLSHNISHFILSPKIETAIRDVPFSQKRHEDFLQSRASARSVWRRLRHWVGLEREPTQALVGDSPTKDGTATDMRDVVIENYMKDLGRLKSAINYSTLATACQLVLEGCGPPDLKDQTIATISWQAAQMQRVDQLLENLISQRLIIEVVDIELATQALSDHADDIVLPLAKSLMYDDNRHLICLVNPPDKGHVGVFFEDAQDWLIDVLAYNWLIYPDVFNLDRVVNEVFAFLA
ncbi:hypothetical protein N7537_004488 [Penicillium hordei]|uniref:Uncharacterized protein n=1 Tax=Penicillium hordei TaxID=40994 RepID=A0AAD6EBL2_9EURO|nr:uncharacterized protein N7537_004488 [Penicillium hordei]KAJ5607869.1 hypothetical protein N7537_004488 [Penicillium hordei]